MLCLLYLYILYLFTVLFIVYTLLVYCTFYYVNEYSVNMKVSYRSLEFCVKWVPLFKTNDSLDLYSN